MKAYKNSLIAALFILLLSFNTDAAVWRVNNNAGVDADFSSLTTAMSTASIGDTLYLEGSPTSYGNVTLNKKLTIIGTGYFLSGYGNDSTQANPNSSKIGTLTISPGAQGSVITGISASGSATGYLVTISTNDITISRCYFYHTTPNISSAYTGGVVTVTSGISNILISQSFLHETRTFTSGTCGSISYNIRVLYLEGNNSGIILANNLIKHGTRSTISTCWTFYALDMAASSSAVICNNVFIGTVAAYNSMFVNNIQILGGVSGIYNTSGSYPNITQNNIGYSTQFGNTSGNQQNVTMSNVFTFSGGGEDVDNHYKLKSGSPAIGTGMSGVDCGIFGGISPYVLSGIPAIPAIFSATVPAMGTTSTGINVNTKAKARK